MSMLVSARPVVVFIALATIATGCSGPDLALPPRPEATEVAASAEPESTREAPAPAETRVPVSVTVERLIAADDVDGTIDGLSADGVAFRYERLDGAACRRPVAEPGAVPDCIDDRSAGAVLLLGSAFWPAADGPLVVDGSSRLRAPMIVDFATEQIVELFGDDPAGVVRLRRPLALDGDRLLLVEESNLLVTDLDGAVLDTVASRVDPLITVTGILRSDVVVTTDISPGGSARVVRYGSDERSIGLDLDQIGVVDLSADTNLALVLDFRARNLLRSDTFHLVDFKDQASRIIEPLAEPSSELFSQAMWFSASGTTLYGLFADPGAGTLTLAATPLDGAVAWVELQRWNEDDEDMPTGFTGFGGIPRSGDRFFYVSNDDEVYQVIPSFE